MSSSANGPHPQVQCSWGLIPDRCSALQARSDGSAASDARKAPDTCWQRQEAACREAKLFKQLYPSKTFLPSQFFQDQPNLGLFGLVTHTICSQAACGTRSRAFDSSSDPTSAGSTCASAAFPSIPCQCGHQHASQCRGCSQPSYHSLQTQPVAWPTTPAGWAYAAAGCGVGILEAPSALLRQACQACKGSLAHVHVD